MPPRILFLDHTAALGGAELYLLDIVRPYRDTASVLLFEEGPFAERLREETIDVEVVPGASAVLDVRREDGGLATLRSIPSILQLAWSVAQQARDYDLIYANSQKSLVIGAVARWMSRTPLIWNLHDMLTADHFSALNRRVAVLCANWGADRIIVNSDATRKAFAQSGGWIEKTGLVYNGIPAAPFESVNPEEIEQLQIELDLPDAPLVGVFSRLAPWKGQHVLLHALTELPSVHALLVGEALFDGDTSYADKLRALSHRLDLTDRVHFLGFRDDIPTLMHAVDVVAHTSTAPEPFGRVIVEGMLARTPVVATRAGGPMEIIDEGKTGRLVPPEDAAALAEALRPVLTGESHATADMVDRAHEMACSRFSVETMQNAVDAELHRTLNS